MVTHLEAQTSSICSSSKVSRSQVNANETTSCIQKALPQAQRQAVGNLSLWSACLNPGERDEWWGGGIVYCIKGKQWGPSSCDYWHKQHPSLWASPPLMSDRRNKPLTCLIRGLVQTDFLWKDGFTRGIWQGEGTADSCRVTLQIFRKGRKRSLSSLSVNLYEHHPDKIWFDFSILDHGTKTFWFQKSSIIHIRYNFNFI